MPAKTRWSSETSKHPARSLVGRARCSAGHSQAVAPAKPHRRSLAVLGRDFLSAKTMGTGTPLPAQEAEWVENSLWQTEQVDEEGAATIRRAA